MTLALSLGELSALLLELYRRAEQLAPEAYQGWALGLLQSKLRFDAAIWTSGHIDDGRWSTHCAHLIGLPAKALEHYVPLHAEDGQAPGARAFMQRWQLAHELAFVAVDPLTSLATSITLYRKRKGAAFTDGERRFFESAAAHLAENYGFAAIQQLLRSTRSGSADISSSAVADRFGLLQVAPAEFQRLLRLEWPQWRERKLPDDIGLHLDTLATHRFVGERIVVSITTLNDVFLLQARDKRRADALSGRELEVALLLAGGRTYKEVAKQLGLAPSTVRNHLASIFTKLGVGKQSDMAVALGVLN
jgi:DNA-binding CsgD family transcriptional regulator